MKQVKGDLLHGILDTGFMQLAYMYVLTYWLPSWNETPSPVCGAAFLPSALKQKVQECRLVKWKSEDL